MDSKLLTKTARSWNAFLEENGVPASRYMDCFRDFMRRERPGRFTVYDLREAWLRIKPNLELVKKATTINDRLCGGCYGTGWASKELVVGEDGKRSWRELKTKGGSSSVKPCICAKGRQFDRGYKQAVEQNEKAMRSFKKDSDDK